MASNNTNNNNAYQNPENIAVFQQQSQFIQPFTPSTTTECEGTYFPLTHPQQISIPPMFDNSVLAETQRQNSGVRRPATTKFGERNATFDKAGHFDLRLEVARSILMLIYINFWVLWWFYRF